MLKPYNQARIELVLKGLNRKYPQATEWKFSECTDGDLGFATDEDVRIFPIGVFNNCASVLNVWDYIEKNWNLHN